MDTFIHTWFSLRLIFIVAAGLFLVLQSWPRVRNCIRTSFTKPTVDARAPLLLLSIGYLTLASLCKISQKNVRLLNGEDFWIFEDMLHWMSRGLPYITRFASHAAGPVQHGFIHSFPDLWFLVPFVWLFGPLTVALLLNPISIALGGYLIGFSFSKISGSRWLILGAPIAFWMLDWTNQALLYDTHPECIYLALVFCVYLATLKLNATANIKNWILFVGAWILLASLKQDGLVYGSLLWFFFVVEKKFRLKPAVASLLIVFVSFAAMTHVIGLFHQHVLGAASVDISGFQVPVADPPAGPVNLNGKNMTSLSGVFAVAGTFFAAGLITFVKNAFSFLFFSQFSLMTLFVPWIWFRRSFWLLVAPLALLIGGMHTALIQMHIYNSIIFMALLWVAVVHEYTKKLGSVNVTAASWAVVWTLCFAGIHGASAPEFYFPNEMSRSIPAEAAQLIKDQKGLGIVSSRLLKDVNLNQVWGDQVNVGFGPIQNPPSFVKWVLVPKQGLSFEMLQSNFLAWRERALQEGAWHLKSTQNLELLTRD